jgi:hypothetical protein
MKPANAKADPVRVVEVSTVEVAAAALTAAATAAVEALTAVAEAVNTVAGNINRTAHARKAASGRLFSLGVEATLWVWFFCWANPGMSKLQVSDW